MEQVIRTGKKNASLIEVFVVFFKLGSISFGGGYAMVPLIENEVVEKKKWIAQETAVDIIAVAGSLPGAIGLNAAALVGYSIAGIPGTLVAILGNLSPCVLIVLSLSVIFQQFSTEPSVQAAFSGIRPAVIALIAYAAYTTGKMSIHNNACRAIAILAFCAMMIAPMYIVLIIVSGALTGIFLDKYKCYLSKR